MAGYSREQAIDFWYAFDQAFLFDRPPEVAVAFPAAYPDGNLNDLVDFAKGATSQADLAQRIAGREAGLLLLAAVQDRVMRGHFPDAADLQRAFEDFGQGVLFDDRNPRPPSRRIHMMDGTAEDWVGYHRWYAFTRAVLALGASPERWSLIGRFAGLAWAIQSEAEPRNDDPQNPGLAEHRLATLRTAWLAASDTALHKAFLSYTGAFQYPNHIGQVRAPAPELLGPDGGAAGLAFADIRDLLDAATASANPIHGGGGRFWHLPRAEFMTAAIEGVQVIAAEGDGRGARSGLVQALRGTLPGFPRMPLNRPPLSGSQIDAIESWVDRGCPE